MIVKLKTEFNSEDDYNSFIDYFNNLDVFYIEDFKNHILQYITGNSSSASKVLIKYLKDNNLIQFAGYGRIVQQNVNKKAGGIQTSKEKKYIRVNTLTI